MDIATTISIAGLVAGMLSPAVGFIIKMMIRLNSKQSEMIAKLDSTQALCAKLESKHDDLDAEVRHIQQNCVGHQLRV